MTTKSVKNQSWDDFWTEVSGAGTETIRGVTVPIPTDVSMQFWKRLEELHESSADEDVEELVSMLFGEGVLAKWQAAGIGYRELQTVLGWGMAHASGEPMTFREAYDLVAAEGKAARPSPNRAQRRQSARTGGPSKRTSSASTGSARKTSRT